MFQTEIQCYRKHKNLKAASSELGVPLPTLYWRLKKAGEPVVGDKTTYGSDSDKLAALAEKIFLSLIPFAKNLNDKKFQSKIDFDVKGCGVEIKASNLKTSNKLSSKKRWAFSLKKQECFADFFICFGFEGNAVKKILFVPGEIARYYSTISLSESGGKWDDYSITEDELKDFFAKL